MKKVVTVTEVEGADPPIDGASQGAGILFIYQTRRIFELQMDFWANRRNDKLRKALWLAGEY